MSRKNNNIRFFNKCAGATTQRVVNNNDGVHSANETFISTHVPAVNFELISMLWQRWCAEWQHCWRVFPSGKYFQHGNEHTSSISMPTIRRMRFKWTNLLAPVHWWFFFVNRDDLSVRFACWKVDSLKSNFWMTECANTHHLTAQTAKVFAETRWNGQDEEGRCGGINGI